MNNRRRTRRRLRVSLAISLLFHVAVVLVTGVNFQQWYKPPPPAEPIVAEPIKVELLSQFLYVTDAKKSLSLDTAQSQRRARHAPAQGRVSPKASGMQMAQVQRPTPMLSDPLSTDTRLPPASDALLADALKSGWQREKSIGEPTGTGVSSPQSHAVEIKRGFSQEQEAQAQKGSGQSLSHDAQIGAALQGIAGGIAGDTDTSAVDIVFLLDASGSMEDNIRAVGAHLINMVETFREKEIDFTMGVVTFKYSALVFPQTKDYQKYERLLANVKCGGDERAYDAIVKSIKRVQFRPEARRRFILVTDEPFKGSYKIQEVLKRCREAQITLDVIGLNQPLQKYLARQTGGLWFPIPES